MKITEKYLLGKSIQEISQELEIPEEIIIEKLYNNSINIKSISKEHFNTKVFSEEDIQKAIYNYVVLHQGLVTAGKPYGISQKSMETILKNRGIHKRSYTESKQITRLYTLNDNYFKDQNSNMAWLLGFIASDGNVTKKENSISIQLHEQDKEILEKIQKEVESNRPLDFYTTSLGRPSCKFQVWSSEWKKDLAVYNIIPNKTFILKPPLFLNKKYWIDYIRGYFDGDGSVWGNDIFEGFSIVGASLDLIKWIYNVLGNEYGITCNGIKTELVNEKTKMYKISYYSQYSGLRLYQLLYHDNSLCLRRKKDKFHSLIKNIHETSIL